MNRIDWNDWRQSNGAGSLGQAMIGGKQSIGQVHWADNKHVILSVTLKIKQTYGCYYYRLQSTVCREFEV